MSTCVQRVIVRDATAPTITCPGNLVLTAELGQSSRSNVTFTVNVTDNCGVTDLASSPPSGSTFPVGVTTVTNTATDASGNRSTCTFTVTVLDSQSPAITCPSNLVLHATSGQNFATGVVLGSPVISDNRAILIVTNDAAVTGSLPVEAESVRTVSIGVSGGTATLTWPSRAGMTYRLSYKDDLMEPGWHVVPSDVVAAGPTTSIVNFASTARQRFYRVSMLTPTYTFLVGTNVVTWTVRDLSGNSSTCQQIVVVEN